MAKTNDLDFEKITAAAIRTAKWATIMTKWRIGFETGGKRLTKPGVKPIRRWQLVGFPGPRGRESAGIVDLLAIRRDYVTKMPGCKPGDLLEIILMQIKGGSAKRPGTDDIRRLKVVAQYYHAKAIVLAEWKKGSQPLFFELDMERESWSPADPGVVFR
jgi:hypothetical protein